MAETVWTTEQRAAVEHRGGDLLVSASAGSGKTSVLVAHILRLIEDDVDLDRLLIATFTNSAADEMRQRLTKEIDRRIRDGGPAARLRRQRMLIPQAVISTLDSFFGRIVRSHYQKLEIDPDFRIGDDGELKLLQIDAVDALFERKYKEADPAFFALVDAYGGDKTDEDLKEQVIGLHEFAQSAPDPVAWLNESVEEVSAGYEDRLIRLCAEEERAVLESVCGSLRPVLDDLKKEASAYVPVISAELARFESLVQASGHRAFIEGLKGLEYGRLPSIRNDKKTGTEIYAAALRSAVKDRIEKGRKRLCSADEDSVNRVARMAAVPLKAFADLAVEFGSDYYTAKTERNILDFSDVNHLALKLLREDPETAKELREGFSEIIIDEFQDINRLQEEILTLLSGGTDGRGNRYMVGDVKQSIYGFRMAEPDIFQDKYDRYGLPGAEGTRIDLNANFRSRKEVLDTVNAVFSRVMTPQSGRVDYRKNAMLVAGAKDYPDGGDRFRTELVTVEEAKSADLDPELLFIAQRIRALTDPADGLQIWDKDKKCTWTAQYRDIVILARSANAVAEDYVDTLRAMGIPAIANRKQGFFYAPEIRLLCDLLRVIDNPRQDIPLMAVLVSPMFGIGEDRILNLRLDHMGREPEGSLNDTLYDACLEGGDGEVRTALDTLARYRSYASYHSIHELLSMVLEDTGYLYYAAALTDGETRMANIDMLLERAIDFEKTSYSGIFQFNRYIELLKKYEIDYGEAEVISERENVVRILSIHKSKGLEYPVVFLAGCGRQFNQQDSRAAILRHPAYGIRADYIDPEENVKYSTISRGALAWFIERRSREEELRVLYVAMTRAREKLIITGKVKETKKKDLSAELFAGDDTLPGWYVFSPSTPLKLLQMALGIGPGNQIMSLTALEAEEDRRIKANLKERRELEVLDRDGVYDAPLRAQMEALQDFTYPYAGAAVNRIVYAVSDLKKKASAREVVIRAEGDEGAQDAAERGTAYHLMMCKADPERAGEILYLKELLAGLIRRGQIRPEIGADMRPELVRAFFTGPLGRRAAEAHREGRLYREKPFILSLPADRVDADNHPDDTVMVKGVIDCFFIEDDGIVLADYKTDRLRPGQERLLADRYRTQLVYYADALEDAFGRPVKEMYLYSFSLGKEIEVKR